MRSAGQDRPIKKLSCYRQVQCVFSSSDSKTRGLIGPQAYTSSEGSLGVSGVGMEVGEFQEVGEGNGFYWGEGVGVWDAVKCPQWKTSDSGAEVNLWWVCGMQ